MPGRVIMIQIYAGFKDSIFEFLDVSDLSFYADLCKGFKELGTPGLGNPEHF